MAGGPLRENILKCQLKPLDCGRLRAIALSAAQLARLHAVFPDGVCDWSKPGVEQERAHSPRDYSDGPGGERLPSAPDSRGSGSRHHGHDDDDDDDD